MKRRAPWGCSSLLMALAVTGCQGGGSDVAEGLRPSDGLLADAELQAVVELQGKRDGKALTALLSSPEARIRARAAFALASVQDGEAVGALFAALGDGDARVRSDAAFALGQTGDPSSVVALAAAFGSEADPSVRRAILEALGRIPTTDAVGVLLGLTLQEGEEVHRIRALARLGGARGMASQDAQDHLLAHLDHADPAIRSAAAYYFGRFPDPFSWVARVSRVREALDGYGHADPAAMYLVQALGRLGDPFDGERIRSWARTAGDWRIRANGVSALGSLPPDAANREALLSALDDPAALVAAAAAQSLSRRGALPSELQRVKAWIGAHPDRWQAAAPLLGVLARADEREFVLEWIDALAPGDAHRWDAGLQALAFVPGEDALERLRKAAASPDPRIQGAAVSALQQRWAQDRVFSGHTEAYFAIFTQVLRAGSAQAAYSAAQVLSDPLFAPLDPAFVLLDAYRGMRAPENLEPMMAILESLGRIGSPEATELLAQAALHPEAQLRRTAAAALNSLGLPVPEPAGEPGQERDGTGAGATRWVVDWADLASLGPAPRLRLETERGTVLIRLLPEEAPFTVSALTRLARDGTYDGTLFHRVVPNFVAQGGANGSGDGLGSPGFTLPTEFTRLAFGEGVVGMASAGKDTEGSQFFVTHSAQPHLDGAYTSFGWVEEGMDVMTQLVVGDRILKATVERGR